MPFMTNIVDYHLELQSALTYYRECNFCYVLEVHPVICMAPTTNCILSKTLTALFASRWQSTLIEINAILVMNDNIELHLMFCAG